MVTTGLKPSSFKEWLWSARVLTTIVWILFPLGYITIILMLEYYGKGGVTIAHIYGPFIPYEDMFLAINYPLLDSPEPRFLGLYNIYIPPIPLILVLLLFSIYPAIYSTEKFFKKRGSANAVIEYLYIRKILFAFLIVLVVALIMLYFTRSAVSEQRSSMDDLNKQRENLTEQRDSLTEQSNILFKRSYIPELRNQLLTLNNQISNLSNQLFPLDSQIEISRIQYSYYYSVNHAIFLTVFMLPAILVSILIKLLLEHVRKQFRFYYAKACFEIINEKNSEAGKAEYFFLGLTWYNKFVKRLTNGSIDVDTLYSKIISHSQLSNNILFETIMDSFRSGDELKPMRHILALLSSWKEGVTLVKESLRTKLKESSDLFVPIVTVVITIITTFFLGTR